MVNKDIIKRVWKSKLKNFPKDDLFSVYIDSPFCHAPKCDHCIYNPTIIDSKEVERIKDEYYQKTLPENIREFSELLKIRKPDAAYFGGGTSSLMSVDQMEKIFTELQTHLDFRGIKEKHFEMNPVSSTDEKLKKLIEWKFTHLTFGFQTFNKEVLRFNKRINVTVKRLKHIFEMLEDNGIKYNIDLLAFIFRDNTDEDISILKEDLEIMGQVNPKHITIFPNYKKFPKKIDDKNRKSVIERITKFRQAIKDFRKKYDYKDVTRLTHKERFNKEMIEKNYILNPQLTRSDQRPDDWEKYNSSAPWNFSCPKNHNTIAFGGYGKRSVYSYIGDKFWYITTHSERGREHKLLKADITY